MIRRVFAGVGLVWILAMLPACGDRADNEASITSKNHGGADPVPEETAAPLRSASGEYLWLEAPAGESIETRIAPPAGYHRVEAAEGSFGAWLRRLPLLPGCPPVRLHDGRLKANQAAHCAVIQMDVGDQDLQQCADAVIRLRAEYLYWRGCDSDVRFSFTSGDLAAWSDWRDGMRPLVGGDDVSWRRVEGPDSGYGSFRRYLDTVYLYAGSASLSDDLAPVDDPSMPEIGDVFVEGGFPGHAVVIVDVAVNRRGEHVFLIAQSYMPAQDVHVLCNTGSAMDPWYPAVDGGVLHTPEWDFNYRDLRRFRLTSCEKTH